MQENPKTETEEISLKEFISMIQSTWSYLSSKWVRIILTGIIFGILAFLYAYFQPIKYTSKLTFVVEESRSNSIGLASIAGQIGLDVGGESGGGILSNENILYFLTSENLCRTTLITTYPSSNNEMLADKYAEITKKKRKWRKDKAIGEINFSKYPNGVFPRLEDSLVQEIVKEILETNLLVSKLDRKSSFIEVKVFMQDELLSQLFSERLVEIATARYLDSKTKPKVVNLAKLQVRVDSLFTLLNSKTYSIAYSEQTLVDVNPAIRVSPVEKEITSRDKTMAQITYGELLKNLELAKTMLMQETPVIQVVDKSSLPLVQESIGKLSSFIIGNLIGVFFASITLLGRRKLKSFN